MSVGSPPFGGLFGMPPYPVRRFTVDEFHRMIDAGVFVEGGRVELLEGWIIPKMTHNPPHDGTIGLCDALMRAALSPGWYLRIQLAITTADSEPEPDLVVAAGTARAYLTRHPGPPDIGLVIEVSDSTLAKDRGDKLRIYARAGLVCYWIVNLVNRRVEVYTDPTGPDPAPGYRQRHDFLPGDAVPLILGGQEVARIPVSDLLP